MDKDTIDKERLEAFKDAVTRCRWFILATVITSTLVLFHMYLEAWSLHEAALVQTIANRLRFGTIDRLAEQEKAFKERRHKKEEIRADEAQKAGFERFIVDRTDHELANARHGDRSVPFLGMSIPYNDYLPIMSAMLAVFTVGVWLNTRSILASVQSLGTDAEMKNLARLHFTFTGLIGRSQDSMAKFVQYAVLWLPVAALVIAVPLDLFPMFADDGFVSGPRGAMFARVLTLVGLVLIIIVAVQSSSRVVREIDQHFATADPGRGAP